jgi:hypothetical protein
MFVNDHARCEKKTPTITLALDVGKSAAARSCCFLCAKGAITGPQNHSDCNGEQENV